MKRRSIASYLTLPMLLLVAAMFAEGALAQKNPKPPAEPAPTGTIYYARVGDGWTQLVGMKADGSGKQSIPLAQAGASINYARLSPSNCVHGSDAIQDRWWVFAKVTGYYDEWHASYGVQYDYPHYDLFAARPNPANPSQPLIVQLTDLYGIVNIMADPYWSNDSNQGPDSCVYCVAFDLRGRVLVEGEEGEQRTIVDAASGAGRTAALPITSSEIQAGWVAGDFAPLGPDSEPEDLDLLLNLMLRPQVLGLSYGMDAPGGAEVVRSRSNTSQVGDAIKVLDPLAPAWESPIRVLWNGGVGMPQWSPSGSTVAVSTAGQVFATGEVWTVPAVGGAAPKLLLPKATTTSKQGKTTVTTNTTYGIGRWSHDSRYVVAAREMTANGTVTKGIVRIGVNGGTPVTLNDDSTSYSVRPIRWVSNTPAP